MGVYEVKLMKDFGLFTSEAEINSLRSRNLVNKCIFNKILTPKCFKIKFYEDWDGKLNWKIEFFVPRNGHKNCLDEFLIDDKLG